MIDERKHSRYFTPFLITGMNAIVVYVASEFVPEFLDGAGLHHVIYNKVFAPIASPRNASLLWALAFTALMYLLAWFMYQRRWFVKV